MNTKNIGTPKTLLQAIGNGTREYIETIPAESTREGIIQAHVRDFIAQQFGIAMLQSPECEPILKQLFARLTK